MLGAAWLHLVFASVARPNFLILFVDDLGYNEINLENLAPSTGGYTGYGGRVVTPALKSFAREGMVFSSWYSGWHLCSPSRAAALTGRLPPRTGVPSVGRLVLTAEAVGGLPLNETTFAEVLKADGYRTAMLGKWHLGVRPKFLPHNRGFQSYLGVPYSVDMGTSVWWPDEPGPSGWGYPLLPLPLLEGTDTNGFKIVEQPVRLQNLTARYVARAEQFINQSTESGDPWLLFMSYNHVHSPQFCSAQWCNTSTITGKGAAVKSGHGGTGGAVQELDWSVGRLMAALKAAGCDNNTLTFFTSDNGAPRDHVRPQDTPWGSNAPLSGFKGSVWEGGVRMPAMVRWPGHIRPSTHSPALVGTYDIFTTMLALAGSPLPRGRVIDGIDISPILFGSPGAQGHECVFLYYSGRMLAAVRCGRYKARFDTDPVQLYDLQADIGERHPLPNTTVQWRAVVARISAARASHLNTVLPVQDQLALGSDNRYALCGARNSTATHPHLPNCTLSPGNWVPPWTHDQH